MINLRANLRVNFGHYSGNFNSPNKAQPGAQEVSFDNATGQRKFTFFFDSFYIGNTNCIFKSLSDFLLCMDNCPYERFASIN